MEQFDDCSDRILLYNKNLDDPVDKTVNYPKYEEVVEVQTQEEANLITSLCKDGLHAAVLDFDYPIEVYPSSQLGHYHLYIQKKISWSNYSHILHTLHTFGELIEPGFAKASLTKGYSSVRPIGVVKTTAPTGSDILIENARLRQENYKLKQERSYLLNLVQNYITEDSLQ